MSDAAARPSGLRLPKTPSFRLDDRHALVVGGSSGIGLGCAAALAEAGARVTVAARRAPQVEAAVEALRAEGFSAEPLILDVADREATAQAVTRLGPFDVLVNAAGLARHASSLETTPEEADPVLDVNIRAAFFLARDVAKGLIAAGKPGSLITISSQMAFVGGPNRAVYCASKHAVEGFSKAMAIELAPHRIRVNTLCPTFVRTPLTERTFGDAEAMRWVYDNLKLPRVAEVEDMMGAAVFLASDASAMMTGASLLIDGGWTAS